MENLFTEIELMKQLDHEHIVKLIDIEVSSCYLCNVQSALHGCMCVLFNM